MSSLALGVAAVGTAKSINESKKARRAGRSAADAQKQINRLRNKQAKRQFLRNFRQAQAANITSSVASGVAIESSRFAGTRSSEISQRNVAVAEFAEADRLGETVINSQQAQSDATFRANRFATVANFATQFISFGTDGGTP